MTILSTADIRSVDFSERRKGFDPEEVSAFTDDVCETIADQKDMITAAEERIATLEAEIKQLSLLGSDNDSEKIDLRNRVAQLESDLQSEKQENESTLEQAAGALAAAQANQATMQTRMDEAQANMQARLNEASEKSGVTDSVDVLASAHRTAEDVLARANYTAANTLAEADAYHANMVSASAAEVAEAEHSIAGAREKLAEYRTQALSVLRSATSFLEGSEVADAVAEVEVVEEEIVVTVSESLEDVYVIDVEEDDVVVTEYKPNSTPDFSL